MSADKRFVVQRGNGTPGTFICSFTSTSIHIDECIEGYDEIEVVLRPRKSKKQRLREVLERLVIAVRDGERHCVRDALAEIEVIDEEGQ